MNLTFRNFAKFFVTILCGLFLVGGTHLMAQDVNTDYDHDYKFNMLKGYAWGKVQTTDPLLEPRLAAAVDHILQGYGFKESAQSGVQAVDGAKNTDMIVTAVEANNPQQYVAFYRGMSNLNWQRGWGAHGFSDSATTLRQVHGGTLIVDIYDSATGKLVWRGTAAEGNVASEKKGQDDIDKEVAKMFTDFPPKSGGPLPPNQVSVPPSASSRGMNTPN